MTQPIPGNAYLMVAGVDLGIAQTTFGFSFKTTPGDVTFGSDTSTIPGSRNRSPTSVLVTYDGAFDSFGQHAEDRYKDLEENGKIGDPYGFHLYSDFSMVLGKQDVTTKTTLVSRNGRVMKAYIILAMILQYIEGGIADILKLKHREMNITPSDIRWVLTVPDIWTEKSELLLKEAVRMARIPTEQVILVPASRAVVTYMDDQLGDFLQSGEIATGGEKTNHSEYYEAGDKIVAIISDSVTTRFICYKVQCSSGLKHIVAETQISWGLSIALRSFEKLMVDVFGSESINSFKTINPKGWEEILRSIKKPCTHGYGNSSLNVPLCDSFATEVSKVSKIDIAELVERYNSSDISYTDGSLIISYDAQLKLFAMSSLLEHIKELSHKPELQYLQHIILAGDSMHCLIVFKSLRNAFAGSKINWLTIDADIAAVVGAILYGHTQN